MYILRRIVDSKVRSKLGGWEEKGKEIRKRSKDRALRRFTTGSAQIFATLVGMNCSNVTGYCLSIHVYVSTLLYNHLAT